MEILNVTGFQLRTWKYFLAQEESVFPVSNNLKTGTLTDSCSKWGQSNWGLDNSIPIVYYMALLGSSGCVVEDEQESKPSA